MRYWAVSLVAISIALSAAGNAKEAPPAAAMTDLGFWGILVKPNARWVLKDVVDDDKSPGHRRATVTVETYDLRTVGTARVGRLRWTAGKAPFEQCGAVCLHRVAVTPAGLYFIKDDATDEQILAALQRHPARSNPPRAYPGTKRNGGRYLDVQGDVVCMGDEPLADAGDCDDTCFSAVCIAKDKGVVQLGGTAAPDNGLFAQDGYGEPFVHGR